MQIESLDLRTISPENARAIAELLVSIWPKPGRTVETRTAEMLNTWRDYHGPESQFPRSFAVRDGGRIVAHAEATPRTLRTSAGDLTILALARVCTDPVVRGNNLGQAVVKAAFKLVDDGAYPFAVFQTRETVQPFYEKLGAVRTGNRYFNSHATDPTATPFWDPAIMRYPTTGNWPTGAIDTNGPGW
jgi:predicted N-acetyltransferase YhbS